jgi:predicted dehydrogenase
MLRVAIIGFGKWGQNYLKAVNDSGIGRVVDAITSKSNLYGLSRLGVNTIEHEEFYNQYYTKIVQSGRFDRIDAAIIATHPPVTEKYAIALLTNGISVMAEKPFTFDCSTLDSVNSILTTSNRALVFLINHQHLFSEYITLTKSYIGNSLIKYYKSEAGGVGPHRDYSPIWDYGPHDLTILGYLTNTRYNFESFTCQSTIRGISQRLTLRDITDLIAVIDVWNNGDRKTHRVAIGTDNDEIIYDDFSNLGRLKINNTYPDVKYAPPLSLSVSAFLKRVMDNDKSDDRRFGTILAENYTSVLSSLKSEGVRG